MLYWLLNQVLGLRLFGYVTFRTAFASLTALFLCIIIGPWLIRKLREFQIGQHIREEGPRSHQKKAGTPTMGGVLIIISIVVPTLCGWTCGIRMCGWPCSGYSVSARSAFTTTTRRSARSITSA
jgi:UDP-N-acetylmuramyl pentapeptide phosphotransferase/UDP-N-acetylglucosamine-1-phosphate transferase